ncbi:myeloid differentiation primary response protein MyD88-like [Diadema antillarum]|uniref:myeloid differentiation primary response protein MyD88-like n=1 Tax=Diadema antillarum TaxID=105358 RepID=UPI003A86860E
MSNKDLTARVYIEKKGNDDSAIPTIHFCDKDESTSSNRDQMSVIAELSSVSCASAASHSQHMVSSPACDDKTSSVLKSSSMAGPGSYQTSAKTDEKRPVIDRSIPAIAIGRQTRRILSQFLTPPKYGSKNWEDMAEEMGFNYQLDILNFQLKDDPVATVMSEWSTKSDSTVGRLLDILDIIDRPDVLDALPDSLAVDCRRWRERQAQAQTPVQVPEVSGGSLNAQTAMQQLRGITMGDDPSGPLETFDAYVCFAETDYSFVQTLIQELEGPPHNFKLCIDIRNLVPGGSYETVTAEIIENRCRKMLVILSPEFLLSRGCDFQTKVAVSLSPGAMCKRIIPIMVKPCTPPNIIRHITMCDFTKSDLLPWLWDRLRRAMRTP